MENQIPESFDEDFKPTGAIAFFIALALLGAIIWFSVYFIMVTRA